MGGGDQTPVHIGPGREPGIQVRTGLLWVLWSPQDLGILPSSQTFRPAGAFDVPQNPESAGGQLLLERVSHLHHLGLGPGAGAGWQ